MESKFSQKYTLKKFQTGLRAPGALALDVLLENINSNFSVFPAELGSKRDRTLPESHEKLRLLTYCLLRTTKPLLS